MDAPTLETERSVRSAVRQLRHLLAGLQRSGIETFHPISVSISPQVSESFGEEPATPDSGQLLHEIRNELGDCRRCRLHEGRTHLVFGEGSPKADLVFVGEGPGFDEDRQGRPFVGRAGRLLDKMIQAIQLKRENVYICNVVKCRPPNNRTPSIDEIERCSPFLFQQLEAIRPRVICALGLSAAQTLLGSAPAMGRLRGKTFHWRGIPLICTYHPAYLLRSPAQKAAAWQDLLEVQRHLSPKQALEE